MNLKKNVELWYLFQFHKIILSLKKLKFKEQLSKTSVEFNGDWYLLYLNFSTAFFLSFIL
jgi:hypothetical protein